ncbi:MAG: hypothetical protein A2664_01425 [Candidatus Taylorbacteria bacterium RIFCSPHIGHO2_01_FULL_46_22b]|uniref:VTT domain-containing protein n=1 Tax=Candidatus Taylorbacteria bacterium RIFCSPHIGHO2_01_FULL_46_22b TaxID=1802301 RepID=A0A1G2M268_9BACT|nr:MAG: hypothetical protein A2664_01425 [Candidatus Taylorbacteria bacterium RIFCSPHIGHO2_01_FULL_46_22b]
MEYLLDPLILIQTIGLIGVFIVVFVESGLFFGFFFPGDSLLFTAGLLASQGYFSIAALMIGCALAAILGGLLGYEFGKRVGPTLFSREDSFFFHRKHVVSANLFYERHGKKAIILARFVPIARTFAPILGGVGKMHYRDFFLFNIIGAVIWVLLLCGFGYYLGALVPNAEQYALPIALAIIFVSFLPSIIKMIRTRVNRS